MVLSLRSRAARCSHLADTRQAAGQTLPLVVVFMLTMLVFAGLVIDLGNAYRVQHALQASADAAAAGGAGQLTMAYPPNAANASAAAQRYGSEPGGKNPITGVSPADVTENVSVDCQQQAGYDCTNGLPNTVTVDETAKAPTYLLSLLGFSDITLKAHAQACSPCGGTPLDVMIVLDRTGSMNSSSKLPQAKAGILAFLGTMDPAIDNVGLAVLPPAPTSSQGCSSVNSYFTGTNYSGTYSLPNPGYVVVPLSNSYATGIGKLDSSSPLISTVNCVQAGGSTAYAEAIDAAYAELQKDGRTGAQKAIVILSDGAANTGPNTLPSTSPYLTNPCGQGVTSAGIAKANKVLVYSIAYTAQTDTCYAAPGALVNGKIQGWQTQTEVPAIGPVTALSEMATDPTNFYNLPSPTSLVGIFNRIASDLAGGTSRIVQ